MGEMNQACRSTVCQLCSVRSWRYYKWRPSLPDPYQSPTDTKPWMHQCTRYTHAYYTNSLIVSLLSLINPFISRSFFSLLFITPWYDHRHTISRLLGQHIHSYIVNIRDFSTGTRLNYLLLPVKKTPGMAV